jgi:hypothetical protein
VLDHHEFCDHCPGCRPARVDTRTGKPLADDSPVMIKVSQTWDHETTYAERKAFIEVTLHNSRTAENMRLASIVTRKIETSLT